MKIVWLVVALTLGSGACKWEDIVDAGCRVARTGGDGTGTVGDVVVGSCDVYDSVRAPLTGPIDQGHLAPSAEDETAEEDEVLDLWDIQVGAPER